MATPREVRVEWERPKVNGTARFEIACALCLSVQIYKSIRIRSIINTHSAIKLLTEKMRRAITGARRRTK